MVAILIPIFTAQLEKVREATDQANIRNAYAVASATPLTEENWNTDGWANGKPNIGGISVDANTTSYTVPIKGGGTCTIK